MRRMTKLKIGDRTVAEAKGNTEWRVLKHHLSDAIDENMLSASKVLIARWRERMFSGGDKKSINITLSHPELGEGITIILEKNGTWWIYYTNE